MTKLWPTVRLGEVLTERRETPSPDDLALGNVRIVSKISFDTGRIELRTGTETNTGMILARPGDLVISGINAAKGAIAIYGTENTEPIAATIHYGAYTPKPDRADLKFLWWFFRSQFFRDLLNEHVPGGIKTELKSKRFLPIPIPLPPLAEQRRVVARVEALAAQIHEARTLRHQAAEEAEALTGSNASELFLKCGERQPIEALAEVRGGIQKGPHRAPGANPVRYLTVAHVHRNKILTDGPRYFEVSPEELERWRLLCGDVLIIEGNGSADQIGRTALFRGEIENCVHQNHVIRIRPDSKRVLPEFLNTFLNSPAGQDAVQGQSRTSSGLRSLSVGRIKSICVPVPPLAEQRRIVAELDALQAEVDALKRLQAETAAELDALLPAILDGAFKGEL
jgi:type I restriction enzyme, S subunit